MSHCDPEILALRSLGEVVGTPEQDAHVASCEECRAQVGSLRTVVTAARSGEQVQILAPPSRVWDRIRADLGLNGEDLPAPVTGPAHDPAQPRVDEAAAAAVADAGTDADAGTEAAGTDASADAAAPADDTAAAPVVSLDERRARRARPATWMLAAAGVGGIVVGGVGTAVVLGDPAEQSAPLAAAVDLDPLPSWDTTGTAELTIAEDGQQVLAVSLSADTAASGEGYREVWLIDRDVEGMVSLGILDGTSGEFVVPQGVEIAEFPIVDVSLEPFDGLPTHSGNSIVRGQMDV